MTTLSPASRWIRPWLPAFLIAVSSAAISGCQGNAALGALNAITPDSGYTVYHDMPYGPEPRQRMDIYRPDKPADNARIVVFVYGGAWRMGIKDDYAFVAHALADAGHWLVVPDYRLYPAVRYPDFVQDIASAIRALPDVLESDIPGATESLPITLMGHSSGAHTAALIAADNAWLEGSTVNIDLLIAMSGPYDLPLDYPEVSSVFADAADSNEALPITHISDLHPESLLVHGTNDRRVLPLHTERYERALRQRGIEVEVAWLEESGHAAPLTGLSRILPDNGTRQAILDALGN